MKSTPVRCPPFAACRAAGVTASCDDTSPPNRLGNRLRVRPPAPCSSAHTIESCMSLSSSRPQRRTHVRPCASTRHQLPASLDTFRAPQWWPMVYCWFRSSVATSSPLMSQRRSTRVPLPRMCRRGVLCGPKGFLPPCFPPLHSILPAELLSVVVRMDACTGWTVPQVSVLCWR